MIFDHEISKRREVDGSRHPLGERRGAVQRAALGTPRPPARLVGAGAARAALSYRRNSGASQMESSSWPAPPPLPYTRNPRTRFTPRSARCMRPLAFLSRVLGLPHAAQGCGWLPNGCWRAGCRVLELLQQVRADSCKSCTLCAAGLGLATPARPCRRNAATLLDQRAQ